MNVEEYERMYSLEDTYWWFQGRKHIIFSLLDHCGALNASAGAAPVVADLGCGTGLVLEHLRSRSRPVGLDFSKLALQYCRQRGIPALAQADATRLPLRNNSTDLILALDLFEHIENDRQVYAEIARALRPGGRAVIAVPAHPFLWSEHDEALHHQRRYTRRGLKALLEGQPLRIERLTYAIAFTFVPIVLYRLIRRRLRRTGAPKTHLIMLPEWINTSLIWLLKIEAALTRWFDFPFGVSLLAVTRKNEQ